MWAGMDSLDPDERADVAQSHWWDGEAAQYQREHADVLGTVDFVWGPEGLEEKDARILGDPAYLPGSRILEIGAGAAQCSRYLAGLGAQVIASDISPGMLRQGNRLVESGTVAVPLLAADACRLPFAEATFDGVVTSFGAIPFIEDLAALFGEVSRVLHPGGFFAYSAPHPMRWMFPDSPYERDMTVTTKYFDRSAYVERNDDGELAYVEYPHTFTDHFSALESAGFVVEKLLEPQWPEGRDLVWGGWGPERSAWIPGTLIIRARLARP